MKQKYLMQFISVAVGNHFPNSISNHLRNKIHNQNSDCRPLFYVQRRKWIIFDRSEKSIRKDFINIFQQVKQLLEVYHCYCQTSSPVYQTLGEESQTNDVQPEEIIAAYSDEINVEMQYIVPSNDIQTLNEMLVKTIQQDILIPNSLRTIQQVQQTCKLIQSRIKEISKIIQPNQCNEILVKINMINQCADGNLIPSQLTEAEKTQIQNNMESENLKFLVEDLIKKYNKSLKQQQQVLKSRLQNAGCVVRSRSSMRERKPSTYVESIASENLKILKILLESEESLDLRNELLELKSLIEDALKEINFWPDCSRENNINKKKIVELVKLLDILLSHLKEDVKKKIIIDLISQFMKLKDNIKEPYPDLSEDPYYEKYLLNQFSLDQEFEQLHIQVGRLFEGKECKTDQYVIEQFEKYFVKCLKQCLNRLKLVLENCESVNQKLVNEKLREIIYNIISALRNVFVKLNILFPSVNSISFRRIIAILYHIDTQINKQIVERKLQESIQILEDCFAQKGFVQDFVSQIEAVACCDYDYLYRPKELQ